MEKISWQIAATMHKIIVVASDVPQKARNSRMISGQNSCNCEKKSPQLMPDTERAAEKMMLNMEKNTASTLIKDQIKKG